MLLSFSTVSHLMCVKKSLPQYSFFLLLFWAVLGLHCYMQAFSSCGEWGLLSSWQCAGLLVLLN